MPLSLNLMSDTWIRFPEGAGLAIDNIIVDGDLSHIKLNPHPRLRFKTAGSEEFVPLVGVSLWAAKSY